MRLEDVAREENVIEFLKRRKSKIKAGIAQIALWAEKDGRNCKNEKEEQKLMKRKKNLKGNGTFIDHARARETYNARVKRCCEKNFKENRPKFSMREFPISRFMSTIF